MAASGQYPSELPEVLEFAVGDEIIGIRGGVLFRASTGVLPAGGGGVTVVQVIENETDTVPSSAVLFGLGQDFALALLNKADVYALDDYATLASLDDKAELDSPVFTGTPTAPTPNSNDDSTALATTKFVHDVVKAQLVGLLDDRGNYDPTDTSDYPTGDNNGSGTEGAILKGDLWSISADGTIGGIAVTVGDTVRALVNAPAQTASNWAIIQNNITYVPENVTNKSTDANLGSSNTLYPTQKAVKDYVTGNALTLASVRYVFTDVSTSTSIAAGKVTAAGRDIINSTAASPITLTLPVIGSLNIGDSVNIRQGGLGTVTVAAGGSNTLSGTGVFTAANETKTAIVFSATQWVIIGG